MLINGICFVFQMASDLLMAALITNDEDLMLAAGILLEEQEMERKEEITHRFNFNSTPEERCWNLFRFQKEHILLMKEQLHIPDIIHLKNNSVFTGVDALCILLRRLAYPCRLCHLALLFGRLKSELSLVIQFVADHIMSHFGHLLSNLNLPMLSQQNVTEFSQAIQRKGCPLPNCWGFIDGTVLAICRPQNHQGTL